jgi:serine/threonine protein kinase
VGVTKVREYVGSYRLARLIRVGGSCQVWEGVHKETSERYALKMLKPELSKNREEIGYLRHEYEVAGDLRHPNIIRFYGFETQYYSPFLVLELFSALNLKQVLREGPDAIAHIAEKIIHKLTHGLHYMHEKGWIHCDVKPDNFLVNDDGDVKLIDFTISQRPKRSLLSYLGIKGPVKGTRSYMSPEQIRGQTLDGRSDVYSFGCVIFELLCGRTPYTGSNPNELLERHLKSSIPSAVVYNKNVTRECADLLRRMMAKKRESRPKSMWEVLQEFRNIQVFSRKPPIPKLKLSELDVGPVTDADQLKQLPQKPLDEEDEEDEG